MTLLGPAPAACLSVLALFFSSITRRPPWQTWLANLSNYAFFPLVGGLAFELIGGPGLLKTDPATFFLLVFAVFMVTNVLNFLLVAVDFRVFEGWSIVTSLREIYGPVLPVEFATGLLTAGVAFAYQGHNLARDRPDRRDRPRLPVPVADHAELDQAARSNSRAAVASWRRFRSASWAPCCRLSPCATR